MPELFYLSYAVCICVNQEEPEKAPPSEKTVKSRGILGRQANGFVPEQVLFHYFFRL